jgi:iron complex outermembrane receptor protein
VGSEYLQREFGSDPALNFTRGYLNMSQNRLLVFVVSAGLGASAVMAQSNPPNQPKKADQAGGLEEVVVTAERREASLQSVPIAVSAITTERLEKLQITEARDLQRYVPSLKMSNNITSPTNLSPSLRGSLQQDASLVVAESPFGIYVDDVYIGRLNGNNVTLADIERVEVLRGPQGTLYGRNTLAGALKFMTRVPGDESWLNAKVGGGNYSQYLASVSLGGPIAGNWSGSFAGQINNKDGQ